MNRIVIALVACALAGCHPDHATRPNVDEVALTPDTIWAGGTVTIRSPRFRDMLSPSVRIDTRLLPAVRVGADSVAVVMPAMASGTVVLRMPEGDTIGSVHVAGFLDHSPTPDNIGSYLLVWPDTGAASIVGGLPDRVFRFLPASGILQTLITGFTQYNGWYSTGVNARLPGRTPDESVLLLQPRVGFRAQAWQLLPDTQYRYTAPVDNIRHLAQLNDSTWLKGFSHRIELEVRGSDRPRNAYEGGYEEIHEVVLSTRAGRAAVRVQGSPTGPPVFRLDRPDTAYHVRQLFRSYGVAFSENGDTLWMLGVRREFVPERPGQRVPALLALDARSGLELGSRGFPGYDVFSMRKDPRSRRLFVLAQRYEVGSPMTLFVLDAHTLRELGRMEAPEEVPCGGQAGVCGYSVIASDAHAIYAVNSRGSTRFANLRP